MTITTGKILLFALLTGGSLMMYRNYYQKNYPSNFNLHNTSQNLRGKLYHSVEYINGDVKLEHLLKENKVSLRMRRLSIIPENKAISVPCQNSTSDCGKNGVCRQDSFCHCDSGYFSLDINKPCAKKGKSQTLLALLWYPFGYTGVSAFLLGWTTLGVSVIMTFCCGICCRARGLDETLSNSNRGISNCLAIISIISCTGLWIFIAIKISFDGCVDSDNVPCKGW
tara:strand:+ start:175 stop:849 length:675 start_codon:yes stop_codon:yes gene_type:complete